MSTARDDGGPAFPQQAVRDHDGLMQPAAVYGMQPGMSLRDHYAGLAMGEVNWSDDQEQIDRCAAACFRIADAMLKARSA